MTSWKENFWQKYTTTQADAKQPYAEQLMAEQMNYSVNTKIVMATAGKELEEFSQFLNANTESHQYGEKSRI